MPVRLTGGCGGAEAAIAEVMGGTKSSKGRATISSKWFVLGFGGLEVLIFCLGIAPVFFMAALFSTVALVVTSTEAEAATAEVEAEGVAAVPPVVVVLLFLLLLALLTPLVFLFVLPDFDCTAWESIWAGFGFFLSDLS